MSLNKCSLSSIPLLLNLDPLLLQLDIVFKISFSYTEPWKIDSFSLAPWHPTTKPRQERMSHQRLRWGGSRNTSWNCRWGPELERRESGDTGRSQGPQECRGRGEQGKHWKKIGLFMLSVFFSFPFDSPVIFSKVPFEIITCLSVLRENRNWQTVQA